MHKIMNKKNGKQMSSLIFWLLFLLFSNSNIFQLFDRSQLAVSALLLFKTQHQKIPVKFFVRKKRLISHETPAEEIVDVLKNRRKLAKKGSL
jgi:hypothetical protein